MYIRVVPNAEGDDRKIWRVDKPGGENNGIRLTLSTESQSEMRVVIATAISQDP